jgi:general secretion pathway protein L
MQFSLNQPVFPAIAVAGHRFARWWWNEFLDLLPERIAQFISGGGRKRLTLRVDEQGLSLMLLQPTAEPVFIPHSLSARSALEVVDKFLVGQGLRRADVDLGIELPVETIFSRQIWLPIEAERAIDAIVAQDLVRKTPFRVEDIYFDYTIAEGRVGKTFDVRQWIVRRQFVQKALEAFGVTVEQIDFVTAEPQAGEIRPLIRLRRNAEARYRLYHKLAYLMGCSAIVLILVAGGLRYWNQQVEIDRLDREIAEMSQKAAQVRALIDQLEQKRGALARLRLQRSVVPGLIDLWDETSRILPDHTWLTELRLSEGLAKAEPQLTLIGFSSAAPGLVATIDKSRLLSDATLTSPVALDPIEGRERFTLQAKVRVLAGAGQ